MKVVVWMVWGTGLTKRGKREFLKSCPYLNLSSICTNNTVNTQLHQECSLIVEHLCSMCDIKGSVSNTKKINKVNAGSTILQYIYFGTKIQTKKGNMCPLAIQPFHLYPNFYLQLHILEKLIPDQHYLFCFASFPTGTFFSTHKHVGYSTPDPQNLHSSSSIISLLS